MSNESILHKRNVLITNGSSALSQALCEQLIEIHKCRVALVSSGEERTESARHQFYCDVSSRKEVTELAAKLKTQFGSSIELVIHQECGNDFGITAEQMDRFVSQTSNDILGYVNLLTCFVPDMLQHGSGRIVSVKNTPSKVHAAIDCQPDYDDLVESIFRAQAATVPSHIMRGPENIRLTTIFTNQPPQQQAAKLGPNLNLTDRELALRILRGIESNQAHVQVHARRNLFEFCSTNIVQLAAFGLDKLQLRKSQKIPIKVQ